MPLYRSFKLEKNKSLYIWEIKESLKDLEKEVTLSLNDEEKLLSIQGDYGAKKVLEINKKEVLNLEINDPGIIKDFDVPNDFNNETKY